MTFLSTACLRDLVALSSRRQVPVGGASAVAFAGEPLAGLQGGLVGVSGAEFYFPLLLPIFGLAGVASDRHKAVSLVVVRGGDAGSAGHGAANRSGVAIGA